jgi:aryl-alcohol dehydrogenase-like predicted oxidoreductase
VEYRPLGSAGFSVSAVSFGTWAIGGSWGRVAESDALEGLAAAIDGGVNFLDTADVYGGGRAERLIAQATRGREAEVAVASKFCRAGDIHDPATYAYPRVSAWCEASLRRLGRERIDLYQIHCPPTEILRDGAVFAVLDRLRREGKIAAAGVSVESVEQGLLCLPQPGRDTGVRALQVILNVFRQKPVGELLPRAAAAGVGILARLPLASGLLTGKFTGDETFPEDDHRRFNRDGERFNVGETFAGLPFRTGAELAREVAWIAAGRGSMAAAAMRWVLDQPGVSCVIPGFRNARQVVENLAAAEVPGFSPDELARLRAWHDARVAPHIRGPY